MKPPEGRHGRRDRANPRISTATRTPTLRGLTAELRSLNEAFDGPGVVSLTPSGQVAMFEPSCGLAGREEIPGDDHPFDAVAVARRLLAAWRDSQP